MSNSVVILRPKYFETSYFGLKSGLTSGVVFNLSGLYSRTLLYQYVCTELTNFRPKFSMTNVCSLSFKTLSLDQACFSCTTLCCANHLHYMCIAMFIYRSLESRAAQQAVYITRRHTVEFRMKILNNKYLPIQRMLSKIILIS